MEDRSYYVYGFFDVDGTPRYIGISKRPGRIAEHFRKSSNSRLRRKIAKLLESGVEMLNRRLAEGLTKEQAVAEEIRLIGVYGRERHHPNGTLWNRTMGGEGVVDPPKDYRDRVRREKKGNSYNKGNRWTDEQKAAASERAKALHAADPERRKRQAEAKRERYRNDPGMKRRISEAATKRWDDPAERELQSERWKKYFAENPEAREEISRRSKGRTASEEARRKMSEARKGRPALNKGKKLGRPRADKGRPWSEARRAAHQEIRERKAQPAK